jgi:ABC-type phosphate/phosphonate transport system substrate-binding protein
VVAATTAVVEHVTAATPVPAPERKANNKDRSNHAETVLRGDAEKTAPASPNDTDHLVALLIARPEIKSVSDLTGKTIAIDDRHSASVGNVRTAIMAAGAAQVRLSDGQTKAINRLISEEVPAAVLALVSPEAAEKFPEIAGFKIFRIPLSPRPERQPQ